MGVGQALGHLPIKLLDQHSRLLRRSWDLLLGEHSHVQFGSNGQRQGENPLTWSPPGPALPADFL